VKPDELAVKQLQLLIQNGYVSQGQMTSMKEFLASMREPVNESEDIAAMQGSRQVCPECREVAPVIIGCSHANKIWVTPKWRAPKKGNDRAWKRIAQGDIWWDDGAVARKAALDAQRQETAKELLRKNRRNRQTLSIQVRKGR
jgi:hypothetical protein